MASNWHQRPGDKILRRPRIPHDRLRRNLGVPALFSAAYGNVGSSIYYALGIVALVAIGATPAALLLAGVLFIFTALSYAEGTAMLPEAGGSATFARHGFNNFVGFLSGWALLLSYIVTISISAYTIAPYLGYFWEPMKEDHVLGTFVAMGLILFLMLINVIGVKESSRLNVVFTTLDITTQLLLIVLGTILILAVDPIVLVDNMFGEGNWPPTIGQLFSGISVNGVDYWPSISGLIFGIALAALAFTGVETVSQMAEETRHPQARSPRALMWTTGVVLVIFAGISVVALSAMTPTELSTDWARDPVAGIAAALPNEGLQDIFMPLVAVLAATILLIATNAGLMGISRLAFSLSTNQLMPQSLSRIHHRFRTPYIAIIVFCGIAILVLIPGFSSPDFFRDLGGLYTFGALLSFAFAHASILSLRVRAPHKERPFKLRPNIRIKGREIPLTAIIGLIATVTIWIVILIVQPYSRYAGLLWMTLGLLAYYLNRRYRKLSLT
ncbi:MAG: APC family permease [Chloroflexota bacterium]|nr:APC family permease [Chloroflexota bacterium]